MSAMYDFYSDTKTKPTDAMRQTVLNANVGDEQKDEDPTTLELCSRVAELLGKQAAVFLPSGTMCNEIAIKVHTRPGDEIICERSCHIVNFEGGGPAALAGAMIQPLDGVRGVMEADQVTAAIRPASRYAPVSRLFCAEQTANLAGGAIWPLDKLNAAALAAKQHGLATHLDGARLMNAVVKSGIAADRWVEHFDSCWIDFTKGLGAPVGAVLAGSQSFIERAWTLKQQMGGAMRQSGILGAMCLYALDHHVDRLAEDHALASSIAGRLKVLPKVANILPVETNIIIFDISDDGPSAAELVRACLEGGVDIGAFGERRVRIVTHLDVDEEAGEALCGLFAELLS
jgi:threonine aldolase